MTHLLTDLMTTPELIQRAKGPPIADIQRGLGERLEQIYTDARPTNRLLDEESMTAAELVQLIKQVLDAGIRDPKTLALRLRERDWSDVQVDVPEFA